MVDAEAFRYAWSRFPTGVAVVTCIQADGQVHGMAANAISSVSLEPLLVLVSVGRNRDSHSLIEKSRRFAINILREDQQPIAEYYARPPGQRTGDVNVSFSFTERGSATVNGCLVAIDCHVFSEHSAGDHTIFIGEVDELKVNPGKPLMFFESGFRPLDLDDSQPTQAPS